MVGTLRAILTLVEEQITTTHELLRLVVTASGALPPEHFTEGPHGVREACTLTEDFVVQKVLADGGLGITTLVVLVVLVLHQSQRSCRVRIYTIQDCQKEVIQGHYLDSIRGDKII
jgi:hypothetical protein